MQENANNTRTPILDRVVPLPARPKRTSRSVVLGAVIGIAIGGAIVVAGFRQGGVLGDGGHTEGQIFYPLVLLFYLYASLFLAIVMHEMGHLLAGLCAGFRVNFVRVGPVQINPPFRVSLQRKFGIRAAGLASLLPNTRGRFSTRTVIMVLGGPGANLVTALGVFFLTRSLAGFGLWLGVVSLWLGIGNLIPFVRGGLVSDGNRILMIVRRTQRGERWLAIQQLTAALWSGTPPECLDGELLRRATVLQDKLVDTAAGHLLAYAAAFDKHLDAEAATLLETALAHSAWSSVPMKEAMLADAAIFQARRAGRLDLAEQWLHLMPPRTQIPGLRAQAEAGILEGQGNTAAALEKLKESADAVSRMPAGAQRDIMLRSIAKWKGELAAKPLSV